MVGYSVPELGRRVEPTVDQLPLQFLSPRLYQHVQKRKEHPELLRAQSPLYAVLCVELDAHQASVLK